MKKAMKIILSLLLVIVILLAGALFYATRNLREVAETELDGVMPAALEDGEYRGAFTTGRFANEVSVTLEDGRITDIKIIKDVSGASEELSSQLFQEVINRQNTKIDAVSGATVTSKAYLKAIENALSPK